MTVHEVVGDLFDPAWNFEAIGHGVNCHGVMGSGIAVEFRTRHPEMYKRYKQMCDEVFLRPGMVYPWLDYTVRGGEPLWIYNIASQYRPGSDARLSYLRAGLEYVKFHMQEKGIERLGLPRIGAGIGGLKYEDVYEVVDDIFGGSLSLNVTIVSL